MSAKPVAIIISVDAIVASRLVTTVHRFDGNPKEVLAVVCDSLISTLPISVRGVLVSATAEHRVWFRYFKRDTDNVLQRCDEQAFTATKRYHDAYRRQRDAKNADIQHRERETRAHVKAALKAVQP